MPRNFRTSWVLVFGLMIPFLLGSVPVQKKARPLTMDDLAGSWVGYTEDTLNAYRLDLRPDGTGRCAYTFRGEDPSVFMVRRWALNRSSFEADLEPVAPGSEKMQMKGRPYVYDELRLTVSGVPSRSWRRGLTLHRQQKLRRDLELLNRALGPPVDPAG
jgi:hypothetical protein